MTFQAYIDNIQAKTGKTQPHWAKLKAQAVAAMEERETWRAWLDGAKDSAVEFFVPRAGFADVAALGAQALGVDVSAALNVERVKS